jgi:hypothetical protein
MSDYAYDVDLVQLVHATGLTWPEKRAQLCGKLEGSLWLADVIQAVGDAWPFDPDPEDPDDVGLCTAGEMMSQLESAPDEDAWFAVLEHFSSLFAYDGVRIRHGRHLSLA